VVDRITQAYGQSRRLRLGARQRAAAGAAAGRAGSDASSDTAVIDSGAVK
jgi:hypothetical protein